MIDLEETSRGIRAVDAAKNEVEIELAGWEPGGEDLVIDRNVDVVLTGSAERVSIPGTAVMVESDSLKRRTILHLGESSTLSEGQHLFQFPNGMSTYLRCSGQVEVSTFRNSTNLITLAFGERRHLSIGIRSESTISRETIRVDPTPEGVARALLELGRTHETDTPDRSYPSKRPAPPLLVTDPETTHDGRRELDPGRPRLVIPESFEFLFPAAPLAYYLSADVVVRESVDPHLEAADHNHSFSEDEAFSEQISDLLYRCLYLDCLVREAGPNGFGIQEFDLIDERLLDPYAVYDMSISDRVVEYLSYPLDSIRDDLPDWPFSVYVPARAESIGFLSYLLDRMASVHPPSSTAISRATLVERSLNSTIRAGPDIPTETDPLELLEVSEARTNPGTVRGWADSGIAMDAFNVTLDSLEHGRDHLDDRATRTSIAVVVNDPSMLTESSTVLDIYRDRAEHLAIDVEFYEDTSRDELAHVFESKRDFVHFVGHCETDGLLCSDGTLTSDDVSACRARTFLLNACGSLPFGGELIELGGAAGVVTVGDVIDSQAITLGSSFALLLMHGFPVERSLHYAGSQILFNKQYSVLGDGTQNLVQGELLEPMIQIIWTVGNGFYHVDLESAPIYLNGGVYRSNNRDRPNLLGNHVSFEISENLLKQHLEKISIPLLFDGKVFSPNDIDEIVS